MANRASAVASVRAVARISNHKKFVAELTDWLDANMMPLTCVEVACADQADLCRQIAARDPFTSNMARPVGSTQPVELGEVTSRLTRQFVAGY